MRRLAFTERGLPILSEMMFAGKNLLVRLFEVDSMTTSHFSDSQIVAKFRETERGSPV
jgi:hypothetical protein